MHVGLKLKIWVFLRVEFSLETGTGYLKDTGLAPPPLAGCGGTKGGGVSENFFLGVYVVIFVLFRVEFLLKSDSEK